MRNRLRRTWHAVFCSPSGEFLFAVGCALGLNGRQAEVPSGRAYGVRGQRPRALLAAGGGRGLVPADIGFGGGGLHMRWALQGASA